MSELLAYGSDYPPLTVRAYRHVIPNGTYHFPRAIEGGNLLEYATVCFRNDEDFGPSAQPLMQPIGRSCATFREMAAGIDDVRHILVSLGDFLINGAAALAADNDTLFLHLANNVVFPWTAPPRHR